MTSGDHLKVHFQMTGVIVHKDNEAAVRQSAYLREIAKYEEKNKPKKQSAVDILMNKEVPEEEEKEPPLYPESYQLKNQFNFSSRGTQTYVNPVRERKVVTLPPATLPLSYNVTAWDIFDTYLEDLRFQIAAKAARDAAKNAFGDKKEDDEEEVEDVPELALWETKDFRWATKLMERIVNNNLDEKNYLDYKYWNQGAHHEKKGEQNTATFKNLWELNYAPVAGKTVTALCWNPYFTDLLAVGYGTYDFNKANSGDNNEGNIAIFSLKNTLHPEFTFKTSSGVMCLDFHPDHPSLLACGLYDGTVLVFDVRTGEQTPIFESCDPKTKHTDPVWQVTWQRDEPEKNINFFSISSDGRVTTWFLNKTELINEEVVELKLSPPRDSENEQEQEDDMGGLAGGSCFAFNEFPEKKHLFAVGTEEGKLYSYSKQVGGACQRDFEGHHQAIYSVKWNPYHPGIFLTCSADWTVKLWEINHDEPVMTFIMSSAVADISWAPFSSTVFAVATASTLYKPNEVRNEVRVYDLSVDKHRPVGIEKVSDPITHITFNNEVPILAVGLDNGECKVLKLAGSIKLAPNLRDINHNEEILRLDDLMIIDDQEGTEAGHKIREEAEAARLAAEAAEAAKAAAAEAAAAE